MYMVVSLVEKPPNPLKEEKKENLWINILNTSYKLQVTSYKTKEQKNGPKPPETSTEQALKGL